MRQPLLTCASVVCVSLRVLWQVCDFQPRCEYDDLIPLVCCVEKKSKGEEKHNCEEQNIQIPYEQTGRHVERVTSSVSVRYV